MLRLCTVNCEYWPAIMSACWRSTHRQRHPNGQQELLDQMKRHFDLGDALQSTEQCVSQLLLRCIVDV